MCTWKYATMKHLNACLWEADSMRQEPVIRKKEAWHITNFYCKVYCCLLPLQLIVFVAAMRALLESKLSARTRYKEEG
jgi:hypothetical protein